MFTVDIWRYSFNRTSLLCLNRSGCVIRIWKWFAVFSRSEAARNKWAKLFFLFASYMFTRWILQKRFFSFIYAIYKFSYTLRRVRILWHIGENRIALAFLYRKFLNVCIYIASNPLYAQSWPDKLNFTWRMVGICDFKMSVVLYIFELVPCASKPFWYIQYI